jgi:4-hydroxy-2-oxoheptanedioate aldolase
VGAAGAQKQDIAAFPHLARWLAAIAARPAVQRAYALAKTVNVKPAVDDEKSRRFSSDKARTPSNNGPDPAVRPGPTGAPHGNAAQRLQARHSRRQAADRTVVELSSNYTVEVIAGAGFDWILLDTEHSPNDLESVLQQAQAAAAYPTSTIARVPWNDMVTIKRFLDIRDPDLLIPYVCSVQEAKDAVAYTRYPPTGVRGVAGSTRATRFGRVKDYAKHAHEEICVLVQVETKGALDELEDICAVDGVGRRVHRPGRPPRIDGQYRRDQQSRPSCRSSKRRCAAIRKCGKAPGVLAFCGTRHSPLPRGRRAVHGGRRRCGHPRSRAPRRCAPSTRAELPG